MTEDEQSAGFGFSAKIETKSANKFIESERLKWMNWKDLKIGQKVTSAISGVHGEIVNLEDDHRKTVHIEWENGNNSVFPQSSLDNIIFRGN